MVHLAAKVDVVGRWSDYPHANIEGTRTVVAACRAAGARGWSTSRPRRWRTPAGAGRRRRRAGGPAARPRSLRPLQGGRGADALAADGPGLAVVAVRPHLVWGPGDTQLVGRIVGAGPGRPAAVIGSGAALIDTTYVDNAAAALVAAVDARGRARARRWSSPTASRGRSREIWPGCAAPPACRAPTRQRPAAAARLAGAVVEAAGQPAAGRDDPPLTRFLAEQLTTAHWFDQRRTREALAWAPEVSLADGFERLAQWYAAQPPDPSG